jgi:hypothetical protein
MPQHPRQARHGLEGCHIGAGGQGSYWPGDSPVADDGANFVTVTLGGYAVNLSSTPLSSSRKTWRELRQASVAAIAFEAASRSEAIS